MMSITHGEEGLSTNSGEKQLRVSRIWVADTAEGSGREKRQIIHFLQRATSWLRVCFLAGKS